MLVECMFSQLYWSLIESQDCCLDYSNPNSVSGNTVNQFETPVRVDISVKRFSLSFISVVNLSMTPFYFSSNDFFMAICKPRHWNLGIGNGIGIGTDTKNAIISSFIWPMDTKPSRVAI